MILEKMEKLIDLLNEYDKIRRKKTNEIFERDLFLGNFANLKDHTLWETEIIIISKTYGFIEHLVKNDLIDFHKIKGHANLIKYGMSLDGWDRPEIKEGVVLMLLSISDDPLNLLISFLK